MENDSLKYYTSCYYITLFLYRCTIQPIFVQSYIKNEKLGITSAASGYPPSEGPKDRFAQKGSGE